MVYQGIVGYVDVFDSKGGGVGFCEICARKIEKSGNSCQAEPEQDGAEIIKANKVDSPVFPSLNQMREKKKSFPSVR